MQETTKRRSKLSVASFLLSLIFFIPLTAILAIVFGILALIKIHKYHHILKGERFAIVGIILGTLMLLFWIIVTIFMLTIAPQIKPSFLEARQNFKVARVFFDLLHLDSAIGKYYKEYNKIPQNLLVLKGKGFLEELPQDPFSKKGQIYKYKSRNQARKIYPKADFLIYSVGPDGNDDGAQKQYSTQGKNGDIIKVGQIKPQLNE